MDIFTSQWLLNMLAKSSKTPQGRLLSLFDILDDWLAAPNMQLEISSNTLANKPLIAYCTEQAKALGASNPTILAEHILLIARNATQQEVIHPGSGSLKHAKKAANALILAQTQNGLTPLRALQSKPALYGIATSILILIGVTAIWLPEITRIHQTTSSVVTNSQPSPPNVTLAVMKGNVVRNSDSRLSAQDASLMYAKYEQMRNGTCQFPEALQIPDKDKAVYLENVVGGKLPNNLKDLAVANFYLGKVRCNFTPMLMARSN